MARDNSVSSEEARLWDELDRLLMLRGSYTAKHLPVPPDVERQLRQVKQKLKVAEEGGHNYEAYNP